LSLSLNGGPNLIASGAAVSLTLVSNTTYSVNGLAPYTAQDGNYALTVNGLGIYDLWDNNAGNISATTQWAKGNVAPVVESITPISPNPRNMPVSSVSVTFSKAINPATFDYNDLSLTVNGGPNLITSAVTVTPQSGSLFTISGLGALTGAQGNYLLTVNATGVQDTGGLAGFGSQAVTWSTITTGPTITGLEPINTNPRNIVVQTLGVTFSEPINPATFNFNDITLTKDGGPNLITSAVGVSEVNPTSFVITNFSWVQGYQGTYTLTVNAAGISDLAGNPGTGSTNESWQIILEIPSTPTDLAIHPDLGISSTDGLTSTNNITFTGSVGASNLMVRVYDATLNTDLGLATVVGTNFSINLGFTVEGAHQLQANAVDIAGNASLAAFFNLFLDVISPTAIIQQVTNTNNSPVSNIPVTFSKAINLNTLSATNFVVTFNGGDPFTPTLTEFSSNTFVLGNLASYTTPLGAYEVTLYLAGVQDLAGNQTTNVVTMSWVNGTTNLPPVIAAITNMIISPDNGIDFLVHATDPNGDQLTYSLDPGAPANATIDAASGQLIWFPTRALASTTNIFIVRATDNGNPPMSAAESFLVTVEDYLEVSLGWTNVVAGKNLTVPISLASSAGVTNINFDIQWPGYRFTNVSLVALSPAIGLNTVLDQNTNLLIQLATAAGQLLQGTQSVEIAELNFDAVSNQPSAFVYLPLFNTSANKPDGSVYSYYVQDEGRVAVFMDKPLLSVDGASNNGLYTTLFVTAFGKVQTSYQLQYTAKPSVSTWLPGLDFIQSNDADLLELTTTNTTLFYRLLQQ
jgi:hypothetical protein